MNGNLLGGMIYPSHRKLEGDISLFAMGIPMEAMAVSFAHGLSDWEVVDISGTIDYNGTFSIHLKTDDSFHLAGSMYINDEYAGHWVLNPYPRNVPIKGAGIGARMLRGGGHGQVGWIADGAPSRHNRNDLMLC